MLIESKCAQQSLQHWFSEMEAKARSPKIPFHITLVLCVCADGSHHVIPTTTLLSAFLCVLLYFSNPKEVWIDSYLSTFFLELSISTW